MARYTDYGAIPPDSEARTWANLQALYRTRLDEDAARRSRLQSGIIDVEVRRIGSNVSAQGDAASRSATTAANQQTRNARNSGAEEATPAERNLERRTPSEDLLAAEQAVTYRPGAGPNGLNMTHAPLPRGFLLDYLA